LEAKALRLNREDAKAKFMSGTRSRHIEVDEYVMNYYGKLR
jgi:hypothetical protein